MKLPETNMETRKMLKELPARLNPTADNITKLVGEGEKASVESSIEKIKTNLEGTGKDVNELVSNVSNLTDKTVAGINKVFGIEADYGKILDTNLKALADNPDNIISTDFVRGYSEVIGEKLSGINPKTLENNYFSKATLDGKLAEYGNKFNTVVDSSAQTLKAEYEGIQSTKVESKDFANGLSEGVFDKHVGTTKNFATQTDVDNYVDYAYRYADETNNRGNKEFPKQKSSLVIGKTDGKLVTNLKENFGVDVSNAYHTLNDNDIRHIKNSHGEGTNEKYPVTAEDIKQIPDIIKNYDDVLYAENNGKKGIYFVKRHNGVTYYLEAIINDGRTLSNKQMIKVATDTIPNIKGLKDAINKKWNIDSVPNDSKIPQMYVQDVENNYVPTDNIPQKADTVNKE